MKKKILNRCLAFSLSFTMLLTSVYPSVVFAEENANMQNPTESDSSVLEEVDETLNTSNDISGDSKNVNSEEESIIHLPENSDSITNDSTEDDDSDIVSENSGLFTDAVYYEETTFNDANTSSSILAWPVPGYQMNYNRGYHDDGAIDISGVNSEGTGIAGAPIVAAYSGTVIKKFSCTVEREFILVNGKYQSSHVGEPTCYGYGTGLVILGDDGRYYKYAHMQAGSIPAEINEGSRITIGQQIGQVGQTGAADGAHLHFGISAGENWWDTTGINPANEDYSYKADQEAPVISSVNASNIACTTTSDGEVKAESFHINFNVSDNVGVTSAWVSIYEFGYTESAAKTYNCTISNGVASVTIPLSDFNYPGPLYGNCYAVDEAGNKQGAHIDDQLKFYPATECTGTYVVTKSGGSPIRYVPYASVNGNDTKVGTTSYKEKVEVVGYYTNSYDHIWYQLADGNWIYDGNLELLTTYVVNEGAKIVAKTCPGYGLFYLAGQLAAWGKGLLSSKASASSTNAVYNSAGSSTDADGSSTEAAGSAEEQTYEAGSYDTGIVNLNYSLLYSGTAYTVTFDGNGGYTETTSKTVYGCSPYGYFPTPYRFGYNFDGWFTSADGGDQITSSSTASGNITLYAHWTRIVLLSGKCGDNLDFILYGDGELDITGTGEMTSHPWTDNYKDIVLNVVIDNGATSICESAFYKCSYLYNVSMPESLLTIGARAFAYCGYLETVKFPEGLTKIDAGAFGECAALTSVNLPKSLVELNAHAFYNCDKLNSIEIPKSLTTSNSAYINEFVYNYQLGPFYGCDGLKKVTFESGITNIASGLFANCPGLETIVIPDTVNIIGNSAFNKAANLKSVSFGKGLTTIESMAFAYCKALDTAEIPDSVTKIDSGAFGQCAELSNVKLSKSLKEMNAHAFYNCDKLTAIEIPKSLTTSNSAYINEFVYNYQLGPFYGCDGLKKVTFESGITNIAPGLFANCPGLETIVIPDTVNIIGNSAFNKAANLKSVSFGKGLTTIESMAFAYCKALDTAEIPDSVTKIDSGAFGQCTELSKVKLSKSLKEMNAHAFYNCDKLAAIEIPKSLTTSKDAYINEFVYNYQLGPFYGCDGLKTVTFELGITNIAPGLFANCPGLENIIIPDTVTTIGGSAFLNSSGLKSIILGKNLTKIGDNAFKNCTALEAAELPDSVTMIQNDAFNNCDSLEAIVLPDSVSSFGERVFQNCDGLKTVKWNNTLTSIPYASFSSAKNLEQFTFSEGIVSINNDAFKNCENLKSIELPSTLKAINDSAFYNCDALTEVVIPDSVTTLGGSAFKDSDNLVSVKLSKNLTTIETSVFEHCDVLSKIVIPYRVTNIKANAFNNCVALTEATIPKTVTTIAANAFSNFYQLTFYGIAGTYAEEYASANSIAFVDQQIHADSISLSETNVTLAKGASKALYLTIQPEGVTDDIAWKSSNTSVATIDDTGLVKAVGLGSTTIKVTVGSKSVSCKVTVVQPVTSIKLNSSEKTLEALDTFQLTAIVSPSDAANKEITWKSSNENVATVDENGLVTAIAKGTASITAEAQDGSGVTAACKITVSNTAYIVSDISELESSHPYDSSCNDFWVYTLDDSNAKSINVTFDAQTDIEEDFDYLYVYDENGTEVGVYTGTELAGKTISITGRTVRIKLVSDDSGTAWGFKVISVVNPDAKPAVTNPFTDVKKSDYFYDAVLWAVENGITGGTTASTFSPNQECTRQQVVMFLWRYAGKPEPTTTKNPFTDVKSSSSFYKAIMWAVETGITSGSTKNTFSPNATCTRQQIAMFLWRYAGKPAHSVTKNPFTDVNSSGTYYNAIMWAVENGITSGKTAATFLPTQECTRAQIVTFLYRMNNIS